jgi:Fe-S-cluster-containing dehydrogenase component/CRP-like cAMP-binding protein
MKLSTPASTGTEESSEGRSPVLNRPQRWDSPFSHSVTDEAVNRVLKISPFCNIDPSSFPKTATLRDILKNDARLIKYHPGDIVVREGDYGSSAFFIVEGTLVVSLQSLPANLLGRTKEQKKTFWEALSQLWTNPKTSERRDLSKYQGNKTLGAREEEEGLRVFLQDFSAILSQSKTVNLKQGEWFGEIAALGRTPRTATVVSDSEAVLLEIRWQGLRDIRLRSEEIKKHIDRLYRERSLASHLRETAIFRHLSDEVIAEIGKQTLFETYGNFEWFGTYQAMAKESASKRLQSEPIIAQEGDYANGLILVRSGFARLSERIGNGHRTISYLGRGQVYGFQEIAHNWRSKEQVPFQKSLRALGYVDVLVVPTSVVEKLVLPTLPPDMLPALLTHQFTDGSEKMKKGVDTDLMEFLVEHRFINGTATMMIDLDRCTRCDDCVRACSSAHENNPRFIRHGKIAGQFMIANACMHCVDPVCMIGCPTGAIHRSSAKGQVVINDATCIGCSTCASSCPYDNIRMVEIRDEAGKVVRDEHTNAPIVKATKCDLCAEQLTGPACQNACPHDALKRVDMQKLDEFLNWFDRS